MRLGTYSQSRKLWFRLHGLIVGAVVLFVFGVAFFPFGSAVAQSTQKPDLTQTPKPSLKLPAGQPGPSCVESQCLTIRVPSEDKSIDATMKPALYAENNHQRTAAYFYAGSEPGEPGMAHSSDATLIVRNDTGGDLISAGSTFRVAHGGHVYGTSLVLKQGGEDDILNANEGVFKITGSGKVHGSSIILKNSGDLLNGNDGAFIVAMDGKVYTNGKLLGEKGDKGDQGVHGEKGDTGDKGDKGEPGKNGSLPVAICTSSMYSNNCSAVCANGYSAAAQAPCTISAGSGAATCTNSASTGLCCACNP